MELPPRRRRNALLGPYHHQRARRLAPLRTASPEQSPPSARSPEPRPRILVSAPPLSLSPHRRNHQAPIPSLLVPTSMALRYSARPRLLPSRQWPSRPAPRRSHRNRPQHPRQRRPLAAPTLLQRENLFRAGTPRCPQPLEHSPSDARTEVVESGKRRPERRVSRMKHASRRRAFPCEKIIRISEPQLDRHA